MFREGLDSESTDIFPINVTTSQTTIERLQSWSSYRPVPFLLYYWEIQITLFQSEDTDTEEKAVNSNLQLIKEELNKFMYAIIGRHPAY